jgi:uncharacterized phage-associated protein
MHGFKFRKAAQVSAFFALKSGGDINTLKLAKLHYLTERKSMELFDEPMFFDRFVSMDHGPVASTALNLVNGLIEDKHWPIFMGRRNGHLVGATTGVGFKDFDCLCKADVKILNLLWEEFGQMDRFELRDWTHENCPEWEDPDGSSNPISHELVYKFMSKDNPHDLAADIISFRAVSASI